MPHEIKIDRCRYEAAYTLAHKVNAEQMCLPNAKAELVDISINATSAADFICILFQPFGGKLSLP